MKDSRQERYCGLGAKIDGNKSKVTDAKRIIIITARIRTKV